MSVTRQPRTGRTTRACSFPASPNLCAMFFRVYRNAVNLGSGSAGFAGTLSALVCAQWPLGRSGSCRTPAGARRGRVRLTYRTLPATFGAKPAVSRVFLSALSWVLRHRCSGGPPGARYGRFVRTSAGRLKLTAGIAEALWHPDGMATNGEPAASERVWRQVTASPRAALRHGLSPADLRTLLLDVSRCRAAEVTPARPLAGWLAGWLAHSPLAYVVLDGESGDFFPRARQTAFPGRQFLAQFWDNADNSNKLRSCGSSRSRRSRHGTPSSSPSAPVRTSALAQPGPRRARGGAEVPRAQDARAHLGRRARP
jgi:hypothetical protein